MATAKVMETILSTRPHPEQGVRACLGILRLGKHYSPERLEAACLRAVHHWAFSYKSVKSILETGFDPLPFVQKKEVIAAIHHDNIRGKAHFAEETAS